MFTTYLDKLSSLFDTRFIVAYWGPLSVGVMLAVGLWSTQAGPTAAGAWWDSQGATQRLVIGLGGLFAITVLAVLLQALTVPLVRLYEGYWPARLNWLEKWCIAAEDAQRRRLLRSDEPHAAAYSYPFNARFVRATRLGNTMTAAEEYAYHVYRSDAIIWWPRLTAILPETLRGQLDGAFTPVVALLNLCSIFWLGAAVGGGWLLWQAANPWLFALVFAGGLLLAWGCWRAAIMQAQEYGDLVRAAYDLYRRDLLKQMGLPQPDNLYDEQSLWIKLGRLHYYRAYPWLPDEAPPKPLRAGADPLYFDNHVAPPAPPGPPKAQAVQVTVQGTPTVIVRRQGGE